MRSITKIGTELEKLEKESKKILETVDSIINLDTNIKYDYQTSFGATNIDQIDIDMLKLKEDTKEDSDGVPKLLSGAIDSMMHKEVFMKNTMVLGSDLTSTEFISLLDSYNKILNTKINALKLELKESVSARI